ncbi:diguanylate cyclase domain-containing protein [Bradyrhizobium sp. AUGA SZCCT0042]|uniref:diguanylate cyclase domain-containing protein n=1 Tax=Bradyrhizobium sp. AUGA SZCCT0042 TaxID=2807651 RepID=UPI003908BC00
MHTNAASIGICLFPDHGTEEQALLRNSDAAMYRVKEGGKNGFSIHAAGIEYPSLQPKHPEDRDGAPVRPYDCRMLSARRNKFQSNHRGSR